MFQEIWCVHRAVSKLKTFKKNETWKYKSTSSLLAEEHRDTHTPVQIYQQLPIDGLRVACWIVLTYCPTLMYNATHGRQVLMKVVKKSSHHSLTHIHTYIHVWPTLSQPCFHCYHWSVFVSLAGIGWRDGKKSREGNRETHRQKCRGGSQVLSLLLHNGPGSRPLH